MTQRLVSVDDTFTPPAAFKVADANLPAAAKAIRQIAAGVDLNTITEGTWNQADNAAATLALNYPFANTAGKVRADAVGSAVYQSYQSYTSSRIAIRSKFASNPFGPWVEVGTIPALNATYVGLIQAAKNPDLLIAGAVTLDGSDQVTSAVVQWPDGTPGTLTITARHSTGAVNAYNITYGSPVTKTFTQPTITRNSNGAATNVPQIVVS
jgi:hypothetical protein